MAKPESAIYRKFMGLNRLARVWELTPEELAVCTNFHVTRGNRLKARVGRTSKLTGGYTQLWTNGEIILANRNGALVQVSNEFSAYSTLRSGIGTAYISFADCAGIVAWSNGSSIEYVRNGYSQTFPTPDDLTKSALPPGQLLAWHSGCLWIADGKTLWQSDPFAIALGELSKDKPVSRQMGSTITLLAPVDDGIWISDAYGLWFAQGKIAEGMTLNHVAAYSARLGMVHEIDGKILPEPIPGRCYAIGTDKGICVIGNGGAFRNITISRVDMPTGTTGTIVFHQDGELNQILAVTK